MFSKRVSLLLKTINATNTDIAHYAKCNASNISRLRTGARTPKSKSPTIRKFVEGVYLYSDNINGLYKLCSLFNGNPNSSSDNIKNQIVAWLYEDTDTASVTFTDKNTNANTKAYVYFSNKLNAVMNMLELSNVRLAKMVNIDSSNISRFRNGVRTPKYNLSLVQLISDALIERTQYKGKINELLNLMNISHINMVDEEELKNVFYNWLCDFDMQTNNDVINHLLDSIDTFSPNTNTQFSDINLIATSDILDSANEIYYGTNGLREAVIRFLGNAVKQKANELWLYSDQSMEWLLGDNEYYLKWATLMNECVKQKIKIKIIHNIDRDLSEMISAIKGWIPLYMSGLIEPYYCKRNLDARFAHTLFICPDIAYINAYHVKGCEDKGIYNYITDSNLITFMKDEYNMLLKYCEPLLKTYTKDDCNKIDFSTNNKYSSSLSCMLQSLSLGTMSKQLLQSILERNNIDSIKYNFIMSLWHTRHTTIKHMLENDYVYEFIPLATDEELLTGCIPLELGSVNRDIKLCYTAVEYSRHIQNIIEMLDRYANYRLYVMPETTFENTQLFVEDERVILIKTSSPYIAFEFSHPLMHATFYEYMINLKEQYKIDRNTLRKNLLKYL